MNNDSHNHNYLIQPFKKKKKNYLIQFLLEWVTLRLEFFDRDTCSLEPWSYVGWTKGIIVLYIHLSTTYSKGLPICRNHLQYQGWQFCPVLPASPSNSGRIGIGQDFNPASRSRIGMGLYYLDPPYPHPCPHPTFHC